MSELKYCIHGRPIPCDRCVIVQLRKELDDLARSEARAEKRSEKTSADWKSAIKRAQDAEDEVAKLKHQLRMADHNNEVAGGQLDALQRKVDRLRTALSESCRVARNEGTPEYPMGACPEIEEVHAELEKARQERDEARRRAEVRGTACLRSIT